MQYTFSNSKGDAYYLHQRDVLLRGNGQAHTIYFFAKDQRNNDVVKPVENLPENMQVVETKTGMPVLKKIV